MVALLRESSHTNTHTMPEKHYKYRSISRGANSLCGAVHTIYCGRKNPMVYQEWMPHRSDLGIGIVQVFFPSSDTYYRTKHEYDWIQHTAHATTTTANIIVDDSDGRKKNPCFIIDRHFSIINCLFIPERAHAGVMVVHTQHSSACVRHGIWLTGRNVDG